MPVPGCLRARPAVDAAQARAAARLAARARARDRRARSTSRWPGPAPTSSSCSAARSRLFRTPQEHSVSRPDHAGARRGHPAAGRLPGLLRARRGPASCGTATARTPRRSSRRSRASSSRASRRTAWGTRSRATRCRSRASGRARSTATSTPRSCRSQGSPEELARPARREARPALRRGRRPAARTRGRSEWLPEILDAPRARWRRRTRGARPSTVGLVDILEDYWEHMERLVGAPLRDRLPGVRRGQRVRRPLPRPVRRRGVRRLPAPAGRADADLRGRLRPVAPEPARAALARRRRRPRHARRAPTSRPRSRRSPRAARS